MIHYIKIENFYSIKDEITVSFEVTPGKGGDSDSYIETKSGKVSKTTIIVGQNAAGKTNIFKALAFVQNLITRVSYSRYQLDSSLSFLSFQNSQENSMIEVKFTSNDRTFVYNVVFKESGILSEKLTEESKSKKVLLIRNVSEVDEIDINRSLKLSKPKLLKSFSKNNLRPQISLLAAINSLDMDNPLTDVFDYWDKYSLSIVEIFREPLGSLARVGPISNIDRSLYILERRQVDLEKIKEIIKKVDPSFKEFKSHESDYRGEYKIRHQSASKNHFEISSHYESSGTKKIISILASISSFLSENFEKHSGFIAIDELDSYFHPNIVRLVVDLFLDENHNLSQTQLIFSSHYHHIMNDFDKEQIVLVERQIEKKGQPTIAYRLDGIKGVRNDDNYYAKYISGAYGANS